MDVKEHALLLLEWILTPSTPVFIIGITIVILFPVFLHFYLARSVQYITLPSVVLIGPAGAGKATLVTLFERRDKPASAHTSQVPIVVELAVSEDGVSSFRQDLDASGSTAKKFLLIDTPGHGKLRASTLGMLSGPSSTKSKIKAVVFVVDAGALADQDGLAASATYLYDVLLALQKRMSAGSTSRAPPAVPILIASNKADLFTALPASLVKSNLEAELGRIRTTKKKSLLDSGVGADEVDMATESDDWLGEYGSNKFSFSQMRAFDIDVDVLGGNIVGDGPGVDKWWSWIAHKI
ncbi:srp receptor beta subunit [Grosmannia clavigera kw1407]|uniref:Signal recognition particle receptor subunit beta n=1 Tax=Grosmannia clavigera (strain kw1407 / UAMH 11150) TaxID=655863 RepID=F0XHH9_GROCL|nr:srp receptor beta subunit [Grosmannia clavigera kw1407]EFX03257.1 srp receptor beta subunit [Grosmannia clavigera kw1407]